MNWAPHTGRWVVPQRSPNAAENSGAVSTHRICFRKAFVQLVAATAIGVTALIVGLSLVGLGPGEPATPRGRLADSVQNWTTATDGHSAVMEAIVVGYFAAPPSNR